MPNYHGEIRETSGGYELHLWEVDASGLLIMPIALVVLGLIIWHLLPFIILPILFVYLSSKARTYGSGALIISIFGLIGTALSLVLVQVSRGDQLIQIGFGISMLMCVGIDIYALVKSIQYRKKAIEAGELPGRCTAAIVISIIAIFYGPYGQGISYAIADAFMG